MAATNTNDALRVEQWDDKFFVEFINNNRYAPWMGTSENSVIQVKENLTKMKGDRITLPLVGRLKGTGVTGNARLKGNEESLGNFGHRITIDLFRNGVLVTEMEEIKNAIDLRNASRQVLKMWRMDEHRDKITDALYSPHSDGVTKYADATEPEKDAWALANSDRILAGALNSNFDSDHSAMLLNLDNTDDKLDTDKLSLMKEIAEQADPHIRPIRTAEDENFYVVFVGPRGMRNLSQSATMQQANRDARMRGTSNPLFRAGDLLWNSMLIRQVPEIPQLVGVGAGGIDVEAAFLCGAQTLGYAIGRRPFSRQDSDDYDNENGVMIGEISGLEKLMFQEDAAATGIQHGLVTGYFAAVASA